MEIERKKEKRTSMLNVSVYPTDRELATWGAEYLGCSQSEFVRSAIRAFATHLKAIERGTK